MNFVSYNQGGLDYLYEKTIAFFTATALSLGAAMPGVTAETEALHMEYFSVHEEYVSPDQTEEEHMISGSTTGNDGKIRNGGMTLYDAATGEEMFHIDSGSDVGRGVMANVGYSDGYFDIWGSGTYTSYGETDVRGASYFPASTNQRIFWDGDMYDELLDGYSSKNCPIIIKGTGMQEAYFSNAVTNNDTKNNPCLIADLFGDWREEFIARSRNNESLIVYTTKILTENKLYTLMHDRAYRMQVACQNAGYNQPPHIGYYVDNENSEYDMRSKQPNIFTVQTEVSPLPTNTPKPTAEPTSAPSPTPTPTAVAPTQEPIELPNGQTIFAAPREGDVYKADENGTADIIVSGTSPTPTPQPDVIIENYDEASYKIVSKKTISHVKLILLDDVWTDEFTGAKIYDVSTNAENEAIVDTSDCGFENYDMILWDSLENMKPLCELVPFYKGRALMTNLSIRITNNATHRPVYNRSLSAKGVFNMNIPLPRGNYSIRVKIIDSSYSCNFKVE